MLFDFDADIQQQLKLERKRADFFVHFVAAFEQVAEVPSWSRGRDFLLIEWGTAKNRWEERFLDPSSPTGGDLVMNHADYTHRLTLTFTTEQSITITETADFDIEQWTHTLNNPSMEHVRALLLEKCSFFNH